MKNRKLFIVLGVVLLVLIVGSGSFYLGKNYSKLTTKTDTHTFLYSNFNDKIPEDKRITYDYYMNDFIKYEIESEYHRPKDKIICVSSGEAPVSVKLFTKKIQDCAPGIDGCQGSFSRTATVCGNQYVIEEPWLTGPQFYGVFDFN